MTDPAFVRHVDDGVAELHRPHDKDCRVCKR
jgi:hypothetical protein